MIHTSHPIAPPTEDMCKHLIDKIGLTQGALNLGIKQSQIENSPLPVILWTYGLITLPQYCDLLNKFNCSSK